jgi:hypothetical protein
MNFFRVPKTGSGTFADPIRPAIQPTDGSYLDLGADMLVATVESLSSPAVSISRQDAAALVASVNSAPDAALGVSN